MNDLSAIPADAIPGSATSADNLPAPAGLSTAWFAASDHHRMRVDIHAHPESRHTNVLVLPIGVTSHPVLPLIARLGQWSSVYALYSRFVLDPSVILGPEHAIGASAHAGDVVALVKEFGLSDIGLLGYCTGALVAVRSASLLESCVSAMVCCGGAFELSRRTDYERELDDLISSCAGRRRTARAVRRVLAAGNSAHAEFHEHTSLALRDDETFYKYVTCLQAMYAEGLAGIERPIDTPTLLIAGSADQIVSPENSQVPLALLTRSDLRILQGQDHYLPCRSDAEALDIIDGFLRAQFVSARR